MERDWRKDEREFYFPENKPMIVSIPLFKYFSVCGEGNPNSKDFADRVLLLYSLSYGVKMSYKQKYKPKDYIEYRVYPLEGVWDISERAKQKGMKVLDKNELVYKIMIRQPDFVTQEFAKQITEVIYEKKKLEQINSVQFEMLEDGKCVQMMHKGSFETEPDSFKKMELFTQQSGLKRVSMQHREIYLSDPRKTIAEKLKTVLRFQVF